MLIRAELFQPGIQLIDPDLYNNLVTNHALLMIFGAGCWLPPVWQTG